MLICVGSDDEVGGFESSKCSENTRACAGFIVENELKGNLECNMKEKPLENKEFVQDIDLESWLDIESTYFLHKEVVGGGGFGKRSLLEDNESLLDSYLENLQTRSKSIAKETCQEENEKLNSTSHVEYFNTCPPNVQSTCHLGKLVVYLIAFLEVRIKRDFCIFIGRANSFQFHHLNVGNVEKNL